MKLIHPLLILRILSTILFIETIAFLVCLPVALIYDESTLPFIISPVITGSLFIILRLATRNVDSSRISSRDGFLAVTLSWIVISLTGMMPYLFSGVISSFVDAFFESASGITTTGASIFTDLEILPYSILFWRSFTYWIGGLGIIVVVIIILPSLRISAQQLLVLESSLKEKVHPRTKALGIRLFLLYVSMTVLAAIFLSRGEMNLFDSICHALSTVSTSGISTKNDNIAGFSAYTQYVIALFMLLSGVSYVIYYYLVKLQFRKIKRNEELWLYLGTILAGGIIATLILLTQSSRNFELAFREGFFQVISIVTTTGYVSSDFLYWPAAGTLLLFILFFSGACAGSTTGSIKMSRHILIIKNIRDVLSKLTHSNVVTQIKLNGTPVSEKTNKRVLTFVGIYLFTFIIGTIILALTGLDPVTSAAAAAATLGNIGPALGSLGPMFNYAYLPDITKLILCALMITGRLEILTVIAIFTRSFWKI